MLLAVAVAEGSAVAVTVAVVKQVVTLCRYVI